MGRKTAHILVIGDVVGKPGRRAVMQHLPAMRERLGLDLVVANAENAAGGAGLTGEVVTELLSAGVDCLTTGNHVWNKREIIPLLDTLPHLLRPANYPPGNPGHGVWTTTLSKNTGAAVVNLSGRTFMGNYDCPFRAADEIVNELAGTCPVIIVDFHAEATAEKIALGRYLDGRVSALVGTHTHVATADERILAGGTGYITDVGMTGPADSVIGFAQEIAIERLLCQRPVKFEIAAGPVRMDAISIEVDTASGKTVALRRISVEDS